MMEQIHERLLAILRFYFLNKERIESKMAEKKFSTEKYWVQNFIFALERYSLSDSLKDLVDVARWMVKLERYCFNDDN